MNRSKFRSLGVLIFCLCLCECLLIVTGDKLISLNKPSIASSIYRSVPNFDSSNAFDNNLKTFVSTSFEKNPWIVVDLMDVYKLSKIRIFNTLWFDRQLNIRYSKAFRNVYISTRRAPLPRWSRHAISHSTDWTECAAWHGSARERISDPSQIYNFKCDARARYVRVQYFNDDLPDTVKERNLELREIQVYGKIYRNLVSSTSPVIASSTFHAQSRFDSSKAVDDNLNTVVATDFETKPWIVLDLQRVREIKVIQIYNTLWYNARAHIDYYKSFRNVHISTRRADLPQWSVEGISDSTGWNSCAIWPGPARNGRSDPEQIYDFSCKAKARYVKIQIMNEDLPSSVKERNLEFREIKVFGFE